MNGTMIDMCRKFHSNNLACLKGCYDQLCQEVLIKIHVFCQDLKGYHLQFYEVMSLLYGEAGMWVERCREDCDDLSNLQSAGEQLSKKLFTFLSQVYYFPICLYLRNIF